MATTSAESDFIKTKIPPSKNRFQFIYEAITNSLEANNSNDVRIKIIFHFSGLFESEKLEQVEIVDNGDGFTDEDYKRFTSWGNTGKKKNNRGIGRMQFYYDFREIEIVSTYRENEKTKRRTFVADCDNFVKTETMTIEENISSTELSTSVLLKFYQGKDKAINELSIDEFVDSLENNLLLRFYLEKQEGKTTNIEVIFKRNNETIGEKKFSTASVQEPDNCGEIRVHYERIKYSNEEIEFEILEKTESIMWAHFKVEACHLKGSEIKLCSKNIPVQSIKCGGLLSKTSKKINGKKYLTVFYGGILNNPENVNHSIDAFIFPQKEDFQKKDQDLFYCDNEEFLFFDTIENEIKKVIPLIYKEVEEQINNKKENVKEIAEAYMGGQKYTDKIDININDKADAIVGKLYKAQAENLSKNAIKIKKLDDKLNSINPTDKDYESKLRDLAAKRLELTEEQDREELSKYIIRRDFVTKLLDKILNDKLECQHKNDKREDKEGIIHDLFFKRKENSEKLNDLWILNEDFLYYRGCSDKALSEMKTPDGQPFFDIDHMPEDEKELLRRRPDVYLFAEEESCIIVEFKEQSQNLADHVQQIKKYCNVIANRGQLKIKKFFCYLIGEKLIEKDLDATYQKTIHGDMCHNFQIAAFDGLRAPIADGQLEIVKLSSLEKRSKNRNRIFAEKLGLNEKMPI